VSLVVKTENSIIKSLRFPIKVEVVSPLSFYIRDKLKKRFTML